MFLNHRRQSEIYYIIICCIAGILFVTFGASLGIKADDALRTKKIISQTMVGVGGSIVAAAFIAGVLIWYRNIGQNRRKSLFLNLIGVKRPQEDEVAIVLPRFPYTDCSDCPQNSPPTTASDHRNPFTVKDRRLTNRYSLAFDDIAALRHISSIFIELGLKPPRIEFDDDIWDEIYGKQTERYSAYIIVGLFSNYVAMEVANRTNEKEERLFKLSNKEQLHEGFRGASVCPPKTSMSDWYNVETVQWDVEVEVGLETAVPQLQSEPDFGLISKSLTESGKTCFIIGGAKSRGTRKTASFLRKRWEAIIKETDEKGEAKVMNNSFASVYGINGHKGASLRRRAIRIETQ